MINELLGDQLSVQVLKCSIEGCLGQFEEDADSIDWLQLVKHVALLIQAEVEFRPGNDNELNRLRDRLNTPDEQLQISVFIGHFEDNQQVETDCADQFSNTLNLIFFIRELN